MPLNPLDPLPRGCARALARAGADGFGGFFVQLVTAGNDTTKGMLSSGLLTLLRHPDQLARLRADPTLLPGAVEEIIRYDNPLHYFRRTALVDTELSGTRIAAGDKVAMYYTSANRDERVFADPQTFDIRRKPNPHLSFGMGGHFCLGAHLARLELTEALTVMTQRWPHARRTGPAPWNPVNELGGPTTLPIEFGPRSGVRHAE